MSLCSTECCSTSDLDSDSDSDSDYFLLSHKQEKLICDANIDTHKSFIAVIDCKQHTAGSCDWCTAGTADCRRLLPCSTVERRHHCGWRMLLVRAYGQHR